MKTLCELNGDMLIQKYHSLKSVFSIAYFLAVNFI